MKPIKSDLLKAAEIVILTNELEQLLSDIYIKNHLKVDFLIKLEEEKAELIQAIINFNVTSKHHFDDVFDEIVDVFNQMLLMHCYDGHFESFVTICCVNFDKLVRYIKINMTKLGLSGDFSLNLQLIDLLKCSISKIIRRNLFTNSSFERTHLCEY